MRSDALRFAKERYFNRYSDSRSFQENFNLITSFIQDLADKHIPSKTSHSVSSVPWITPAIRRKICRKNATHAKAKKSGSAIRALAMKANSTRYIWSKYECFLTCGCQDIDN